MNETTVQGTPLLSVRHLQFSYEKDPILKDLSFDLQGGESVGLVGANGAGKSTLLRLLVGLEPRLTGEVLVQGLFVRRENLERIRALIGYVFQDSESQLFMTTVAQDVAFGPRNYGASEEEVRKRTREALEAVHIPHLADKSVYKLSGGEKKLASIATILSMSPRLLLLDEPSAALDPRNRRHLIEVLNALPEAKLIASHDLDFILDTCQRVILLSEGEIVADGPQTEILTNEELLTSHSLELPLSMQRR